MTVNPGASLSLQVHRHRAEHWVVVKGAARVTKDGETFTLNENESAYVPIGAEHRLEECRDELEPLLSEWIPDTLRAPVLETSD